MALSLSQKKPHEPMTALQLQPLANSLRSMESKPMTYTSRTATLKRVTGTRYPAGIVRQTPGRIVIAYCSLPTVKPVRARV